MAYNTQKMLTDVEGKPIPQLYDPTSDKFLPLTLDTYRNVMVTNTINVRDKVVKEYIEGTTDLERSFAEQMTGISVANDGVEHLNFSINGVTRTVYAGEVYNANLEPFTKLKVTAKDKFRIEVLA